MVNSTYDPSTSYVWAKVLHRQIPHSVLLTRRGDGHTSYDKPRRDPDAINAFLVNGTLPGPAPCSATDRFRSRKFPAASVSLDWPEQR